MRRSMFPKMLMTALVALSLAGCPGDPPAPTSPPTILSFSASSTSLPVGGGLVTLFWNEADANVLEINNNVGDVTYQSSITVNVTESTTYVLTAQNNLGQAQASVTINVSQPTQRPTIMGFTSNPGTLPIGGGSATLSWSVNDATDLFISGIGDVTGRTSYQVNLTQTQNYTLTASNNLGSTTATLTVAVQQPTQPPTIGFFSANTTSLPNGGGTVQLSWNVGDATSLSINNNVGIVTGRSEVNVNVTQTTTFVLSASNNLGTSQASVQVTVHVPTSAPQITNFFASSNSLPQGGGTVQLSWNVTDASSLSIDHNVGVVTGSGSVNVSVSQTTTFTLTASNSLGTNTAQTTVTVSVPSSPPTINSFSSSTTQLTGSGVVTLSWSVGNATSLSISPNVGSVTGRSQTNVNVSQSTTYTLTASNGAGSSEATVTVFVNEGSAPIISSFSASPSSITAGDDTNLTWNVSNATSLSIDNNIGSVSGSSQLIMIPSQGTWTFTLTASNSFGSSQAQATVFVTASGGTSLPIINSFSATPSSLTLGESTTFFWNVTGATSLSLTNHGSVSGTQLTFTPSSVGNFTYVLTATNSAGSTTASFVLHVSSSTQGGSPTINFFSGPSSINAGNNATLTWSVSGATSLSIDNGVGTVSGTSKSVFIPTSGTYLYTLTASNGSSSVTATVTIIAE